MQSAGDGHGSVSGVGVARPPMCSGGAGTTGTARAGAVGPGWVAVVPAVDGVVVGAEGDVPAPPGAVLADWPCGAAALATPPLGVGLADAVMLTGRAPRPRRTATSAIAATAATATPASAPGTIGPCRIVPCSFCSVPPSGTDRTENANVSAPPNHSVREGRTDTRARETWPGPTFTCRGATATWQFASSSVASSETLLATLPVLRRRSSWRPFSRPRDD